MLRAFAIDGERTLDATAFNPFAGRARPVPHAARLAKTPLKSPTKLEPAGFRKPGDAATLPELIKFLIDRTGYIRALEDEATPEAFSPH